MARQQYKEWRTKEGITKLEGWARDGLTNEQIAHNIGISRKTLQEWIKKYSDIDNALKKGKEVADIEVENAMHMTATGFFYYEENVTQEGDVVEVKKYAKPNTTAQIFWLKNRRSDKWSDKQDLDHSGNVGVNIIDNIPKNNNGNDNK